MNWRVMSNLGVTDEESRCRVIKESPINEAINEAVNYQLITGEWTEEPRTHKDLREGLDSHKGLNHLNLTREL